MRKKLLFVALVTLFTLFGGGRFDAWFIVCTDQDGWTYEVDKRSVELLSDGEVALRVRMSKEGHVLRNDWRLHPTRNTLTIGAQLPESIEAGSVAGRVLLYLRQTGILPPTSLTVSSGHRI